VLGQFLILLFVALEYFIPVVMNSAVNIPCLFMIRKNSLYYRKILSVPAKQLMRGEKESAALSKFLKFTRDNDFKNIA
jgi:hypothetical protein